jgi:hypothetical protein
MYEQREEGGRAMKQENGVTRNIKRELAAVGEQDDDDVTIVDVRSRKRPRGEAEVIVLD